MRIILFASELAACIGRNKYETVKNAQLKVWKRNFPTSFRTAEKRANTKISLQPAEDKIAKLFIPFEKVTQCINKDIHENIQEIMKQPAIQVTSTKIKEITETLSIETFPEMNEVTSLKVSETLKLAIKAQKEENMEEVERLVKIAIEIPLVKDCVEMKDIQSVVNKKRGCIDKENATNEYERKSNNKVTERNTNFYSIWVTDTLMIGGRCDGVTESGTKIVEVKCRQNRLFKILPDYERVQIITYMAISGASSCDLIQKYAEEIQVDTFAFDQDEWELIKEAAIKFENEIKLLLNDLKLQDALITGTSTGTTFP